MNKFFPLIGFLIAVTVNTLANFLPLGGRTTGEISQAYPTLFTPAGFTFSIWGLIYLLLLGYVVYQLATYQKNKYVVKYVNRMFLINCLANSAWIFAWHYELITISLIFMVVILSTLISIYVHIYKRRPYKLLSGLFIKVPFSLYLGWIMVATIANISVEQTVVGMEDWLVSKEIWVFVELALAGAIASVMLVKYRDFVFSGVIIWATYGITQAQESVPEVAGAAAAIMIMVIVTFIIEGVRKVVT